MRARHFFIFAMVGFWGACVPVTVRAEDVVAAPHALDAQVSAGGRPEVTGPTGGAAFGQTQPKLVAFSRTYKIDVNELKSRIDRINQIFTPEERKAILKTTQQWLIETAKVDIKEIDFYKSLCVMPVAGAGLGDGSLTEANKSKPGLAGGGAPVGREVAEAEIWQGVGEASAISPPRRTTAVGGSTVSNAEVVSPPRIPTDTSDSPQGPPQGPNDNDDNLLSFYDPTGCEIGGGPGGQFPGSGGNSQRERPGGGQGGGDGDPDGGGEGGSPSSNSQPPNFGGGGGGYQSQNSGVNPVSMPKSSPTGPLQAPTMPNQNCLLCPQIEAAGQNRSTPDNSAIIDGVNKGLRDFQERVYAITQQPLPTPPRNRPTNGATLAEKSLNRSRANSKNGPNPFSGVLKATK